jgi:UDP-glucose 4-epimerase
MTMPQPDEGTHPKTILVTGGLGYLGSQLIRDLATLDNDITIRILDNLQAGHYRALMQLPEQAAYQFIEGDILDPSAVRLALQDADAVVHLAALVQTPMSFDRPTWVEQINHWGSAQLLETCLEVGVKRFIFPSTTAVYGPGIGFTENDPCRPQGAYAQSKRRAETAVLAAAQRGLDVTIFRFGTFYGLAPVISFNAVVNRFAYLTGVQQPLTIYGNGEQTRSVIHVRDASEAIQFALKHPERTNGAILNAIAENISILELMQTIQQLQPETAVRFTEQDIRTHLSFEADNSALHDLGWRPGITVKEGLSDFLMQFRGFKKPAIPFLDTE